MIFNNNYFNNFPETRNQVDKINHVPVENDTKFKELPTNFMKEIKNNLGSSYKNFFNFSYDNYLGGEFSASFSEETWPEAQDVIEGSHKSKITKDFKDTKDIKDIKGAPPRMTENCYEVSYDDQDDRIKNLIFKNK